MFLVLLRDFGSGNGAACAVHVGLGLVYGGLELNLIDGEQRLALVDALSLVDVYCGDEACHLRADGDVCFSFDGCGIGTLEFGVGGLYCDNGDFGSVSACRTSGRALAAAGTQQAAANAEYAGGER